MTEYALPFHVVTPEEAEARRKDPTWYRTHWFMDGWGWSRGDGGKVLIGQCPNFEELAEPDKEAVWQRVHAEIEKRRAELRANPIKIPSFSAISMPLVRKAFPTNPLDDLVGVEPRKP